MQKSIQPAMNLFCSLLFYLHSICKQKEAGVLWKSTYHVENCCDFLWSSCISVAFSNLPIYDYTMLQHFSKKKRYTEEGCMRNGVFLVLSVPQKNLAWGKTFLHVKGDGDPSVLHRITASENIISSSPNYLTISKLYFRKYHQQGIFVSFQVGKLQS